LTRRSTSTRLEALSADCREILDRFFARDESYRTIGGRSICRPGRSPSQDLRCLGKLREKLEEENRAPTRLEDRERHIRIRRRTPGRASERSAPGSGRVVRAAQELPAARLGIDEIVERARVDAEFRVMLVDDLEAALTAAGYEPTDELVESSPGLPARARSVMPCCSALYDRDLRVMLDEIAGPSAAPGAGAVSAVVVAMAAGLSLGRAARTSGTRARASPLRRRRCARGSSGSRRRTRRPTSRRWR
jgi:hypothetical protein